MANIVYVATSLDGYIAKKNGNIDWLHTTPNPDNDDLGFSAFVERVDALIMGRNTFEAVCNFDGPWPYTKPVFVISNNLKSLPVDYTDKAELVFGDLKNIIKSLEQRNYRDLYIDGGVTVQNFMKQGLIDEIIITRLPIVLGRGIPLFSPQELLIELVHIKTEVLLGQLVQSHYKCKSGGSVGGGNVIKSG